MWKMFSFILGGHDWFVSGWHSDASIRPPPDHVNTVCDLLAKIINHPKSPPAFLTSPLSHSTFRSRFSHSSVFFQHHFSLTLSFGRLVTHSHSPPLSRFQTHMRSEGYANIFSQDGVTHFSSLTSLTLHSHCLHVMCGSESVFVGGCEIIILAWHTSWVGLFLIHFKGIL